MIAIASVRLALCNIPTVSGDTVPDTTWLFFFQAFEACIAVIMVSLTAFRSLYGQERAKRAGRHGYDYVNESKVGRRLRRSIMGPWKAKAPPGSSSEESGNGRHESRRPSRWDEEEMRVMEKVHTRPKLWQDTWEDGRDGQMSRDRSGSQPESFV